jgi:hypothetical protein
MGGTREDLQCRGRAVAAPLCKYINEGSNIIMSFYAADEKDRAVVDLAYSDPSLISEYVFQEWLSGSNELEVG